MNCMIFFSIILCAMAFTPEKVRFWQIVRSTAFTGTR